MRALVLMLLLGAGVFMAPVQVYSQEKIKEVKSYVLKGDGYKDDTEALLAWSRGERVIYQKAVLGDVLQNGTFLISWRIKLERPNSTVRFNTFVMKDGISYNRHTVDFGWKTKHFGNYLVSESRWNRLPSIFRQHKIIRID